MSGSQEAPSVDLFMRYGPAAFSRVVLKVSIKDWYRPS